MDKLQLFTVGLFLAVCLICNTGKFGFIYYVLSLICVLYVSYLNVFSYRFHCVKSTCFTPNPSILRIFSLLSFNLRPVSYTVFKRTIRQPLQAELNSWRRY